MLYCSDVKYSTKRVRSNIPTYFRKAEIKQTKGHPYIWPRCLRIGDLFLNVVLFTEDLKLLQHNGLIELRCIKPGDFGVNGELLNKLDSRWGEYYTTPYHVLEGAKIRRFWFATSPFWGVTVPPIAWVFILTVITYPIAAV